MKAKVEINRKEFLNVIQTAQRFVSKSSSLPILGELELTFEKNGINVRATDLDAEYSHLFGSYPELDEEFKLIVSPRKLVQAVRTLTEKDIILTATTADLQAAQCPHCYSEEFDGDPHREKWGPDSDGNPVEFASDLEWNQKQCMNCGIISEVEEFEPQGEPAKLQVGEFFEIVSVYDPEEYPRHETSENLEPVAAVTIEQLRQLLPATVSDAAGFNLGCIYFDSENNQAVSTDGHRLHSTPVNPSHTFTLQSEPLTKYVAGRKPDELIQVCMGRKSMEMPDMSSMKKAELLELYNGFTGTDEDELPEKSTVKEIKLAIEAHVNKSETFDDRYAYLDGKRHHVALRLHEKMFPDYQAVMHRGEQEITVNAKTLTEAITQSLALDSGDNPVKIRFNGKIDLESATKIGDSYNRASVPISSGGVEPPVKAGFNAKYILDVLKLFKDDELKITVKDENSPIFIVPAESDFEALVMPLRIP